MISRSISIALGLVLGITIEATYGWDLPVWCLLSVGAVGASLSTWLLIRESNWRSTPRVLVCLGAMLLTAPVGAWRAAAWVGPPEPGSLRHAVASIPEGQGVGLSGVVCAEPELRNAKRCDIRLRVDRIRVGEAQDWVDVSSGTVLIRTTVSPHSGPGALDLFNELSTPRAYGYRVEVRATYRSADPPMNPGEFDLPRFLRQGGLVASFGCPVSRIHVVERARGFLLTEVALAAKQRFLETYRQTIRAPASRLVAAATLGSRRAVENVAYAGYDIPEMFRHAGVGHVLAVSGLHVSVVSLLLFSVFVAAGIRPRVFTPMLILFLVLFGLLTGARPSSMRAVVMNAAVLTAYAYTRRNLRDATYIGLSLSAFIIAIISPLVLFAPSFLLSYGAVLSLVLISPVLDRWLCLLRGGALFLFGLWFAGLMLALGFFPAVWLSAVNVISAGALLWLAIFVGGRWNELKPGLWRIGLNALPAPVRLFIGAQLAIQVGMMIPLSAWFFGRFPVAGVVVNLLAIPAIGVLVQLGILTGLLGLIPAVGVFVALPFGAVASLVGEFFFVLAYLGTTLFPFVAVPKPTIVWMLAYYLGVAAILSLDGWVARAHGWLLKLWPAMSTKPWLRRLPYGVALVLVVLPCVKLIPHAERTRSVTCCSTRDFPLLTVVSSSGRAVLINGGDSFTGGFMLFDVLRTQGASSVDTAILASPHPRAGNEGLASLMQKMPVRSIHLPFVSDRAARYLEAVGDTYLQQQAQDGERWAGDYVDGFASLLDAAGKRRSPLNEWPAEGFAPWDALRIDSLPRLDPPPKRFVSSAMSRLLTLSTEGFTWVVVTDSTHDALWAGNGGRDPKSYDVLVLPALSYRADYNGLVGSALACFSPRVVIVSGELTDSLQKLVSVGDGEPPRLFATGTDGAVTATFPDPGRMEIKAFHSGRRVVLKTEH